jgi:murein DD-endopeptidase MepM/ murein hydrolase activator NlpD
MHKKDAEDTALFMTVLLAIGILLMIFAHVEAYGEEFSDPLREYVVSSDFGFRRPVMGGEEEDLLHRGLDLVPTGGDWQVYAAAPGVVTTNYPAPGGRWKGHSVMGGMVVLTHADGAITLYGHLARTFVSERQAVGRGQVIGIVGATGRATGRHLHMEILYDPARVLLGDP